MLRKIKCKHIGKKIELTGSLKLDDGNDRKIEIMIKIKIMIEFLKLRLYTRCRTLTSLFFHLSKIIALSFLLFQKKRKILRKKKIEPTRGPTFNAVNDRQFWNHTVQ